MGGGNKYAAGSSNNKQRTAFVHNPKSKKTAHILSLPNEGLCYTCHETIEWKKRYRKYKPLTVPGKCNNCHQKNVKRAYHITCDECTLKLQVCGKCGKSKEIINDITVKEVEEKEQAQIREAVRDMTERERRTFYRELEKKEAEAEKKSDKKDKPEEEGEDEDDEDADGAEEGEEDFDSEDYDAEDDEDEEDGEETKVLKTRAQLTVKSVTQDIEKLSKIFTNDAVGTLVKSKPSSADDNNDSSNNSSNNNNNNSSINNSNKNINLEDEEDEDEDEEDVREVLSPEQMYLKLKEQYKNKSKTEKQSNNLVNTQDDDDDDDDDDEEDEEDDEDAIYEDDGEDEEDEEDEE